MRATQSRSRRHWLAVGLGLAMAACTQTPVSTPVPTAAPTVAPSGDVLAEAHRRVTEQSASSDRWAGANDGPAQWKSGLEVDYIAADKSNGGVMAVYAGIEQAAAAMRWTVVLRDGGGAADTRAEALHAAVSAHPAAIVLGGFDASEQTDILAEAASAGIVLVGWHAGAKAGPDPSGVLFTNVSTDPRDVALLAADYVIDRSNGTAGVAIFTDSNYGIALDKANEMKAEVERCAGCTVLAYRDVPIMGSTGVMPGIVRDLYQHFGSKLTYLLAINGNYFAGSRLGLAQTGVGPNSPPWAVAAGDGDQAEFDRIRTSSYQLASVAEPLYLQGWQIVDEINRAVARQPPSGYLAPPGLIARSLGTVPAEGQVWDPNSAYRDRYERIWGVAP